MKDKHFFQKKLLAWYQKSHRALPWRNTRDPYLIWVSEVLLQQTRVSTGMAYYERFVDRFPTLSDLAEAPIDAVLKVWEGLGYYGRARNLHRAARIFKERWGGKIPSDPEVLRGLPGIGPYTAAAIASIAFGKDAAVVDGNVTRVLCRTHGIENDPRHSPTRARLQALAESLLPKGKAARFNQALMELGALVCKPVRPECPVCPLQDLCVAHERNIVEQLPVRSPKARVPVRVRVVAAIEHRGRLLFKRRDPEGLLGGLWELPGVYVEGEDGNREGIRRLRKQVGPFVTLKPIPSKSRFSVKHVYSHFEESNQVFPCKVKDLVRQKRRQGTELSYRWLHPTKTDPYPLTGATRKILGRLARNETDRKGESGGGRYRRMP